MNGKDIFRDLKKGYKPQLNGFDLQNRHIFSAKVGQKLPVFNQAAIPGGEYRVNVAELIQSINPYATNPFIRVRQTLDFYFFPYNYSNTMFNQLIAGRKDLTLRTQIGQDLEVANFCLGDFLAFLLSYHAALYAVCSDGWQPADPDDKQVVSFQGKRMCDCCHLQISPESYMISDIVRALDLYGYGNYLPLFKAVENAMSNHLVSVNDQTFYDTFTNYYAYDRGDGISDGSAWVLLRQSTNLFNWTGDSLPVGSDFSFSTNWEPRNYNLFRPAAYNRVYDAFVRNSYFTEHLVAYITHPTGSAEDPKHTFEFAELFNFDGLTNINIKGLSSAAAARRLWLMLSIFALKPATHFKDLFTGVMPDSQFGDISVMMDNRNWMNLEVDSNFFRQYPDESSVLAGYGKESIDNTLGYNAVSVENDIPSNTKFRFNPALAISVLEQRRANALQIFRERQMRAGNRTSDNFRAHFGVEPYSNTDMLPTYLGSFEGDVISNTTVSTSDSGDMSVGSRAAYATGSMSGNQIEFKSKDFGTIIGILSIVPYDDYNAFMVDKELSKLEQFDFAFSEFDDLGLQAAPLDDFTIFGLPTSDLNLPLNTIRGYLFRYYEHKLAVDKVHGEFYRGWTPRHLNTWATSFNQIPNGVFSHYTSARPTLNPLQESFFYVQVNDLDSVFGFAADYHQSSDQFAINVNFNAPALQPLSVLGLPY